MKPINLSPEGDPTAPPCPNKAPGWWPLTGFKISNGTDPKKIENYSAHQNPLIDTDFDIADKCDY
jgi:hypothetical protein